MRNRISHWVAGGLAVAALFAATAVHADIVNGGFETGDFTGWTQFGNTEFTSVDNQSPHSGTYGAYFGPTTVGGGVGGISQVVTTTPGNVYHVFFWLQNEADVLGATSPNSFQFSWGGAPAMTLTDAAAFGYTEYAFDLLATTASTELKFTFGHDPALWDLDDVTIPEPGTLALVGLAGGLAAMLGRRRRHLS
jgi:hypothetical protein